MKIHQYAHLDIGSDVYDPDQITLRLGPEPTSVSWRGCRSNEPMIPKSNVWRFRASAIDRIDDLLTELIGALESVSGRLASLTAGDASWVGVSIMRSFDDRQGVEEELTPAGAPIGLVKLPGQHQLLGFHLDVALLARFVSLGCSLDFDEYG
jgi:Domain of unknown function (DUF4279)